MDLKRFVASEGEKPLDYIPQDGGFCAIFRKIACIGDSLSSGEFEVADKDGNPVYYDAFEYSWGQYIARMTGAKVYNFSRGGMTAKEYVNSFAKEKDFWNKSLACDAYIIALGVNDLFGLKSDVGSVDDYVKGKDVFATYYGKIIEKYKEISPRAKFFFVTIPKDGRRQQTDGNGERGDAHAELLYDFTRVFDNSYVLDFRKYAPDYDKEFERNFYLEGHLNPAGYLLTAKMIAAYIDYTVRNNPQDFSDVGIIRTPYVKKNKVK